MTLRYYASAYQLTVIGAIILLNFKRVTAKLADGEEFCFEKYKSIGDKEFAISSYGGVLGVKQFKGRNYKCGKSSKTFTLR